MTLKSRLPESDAEELPEELLDLGRRISKLSGNHQQDLQGAYLRVVDSLRRRRRILTLVQEALAQLRLDIKYLMLDLEVTRQERDELRRQLEDRY